MADLQRYRDEDLEELLKSEAGEKKKTIAAEILKRRRQEKWSKRSSLFTAVVAATSFAAMRFRRWLRK